MSFKKYIPLSIKKYIINEIENIKFNREKKQFIRGINKLNGRKKIWLLDACDYSNLGDQAILMAELKFLKDKFSDYEIICLEIGKYEKYIENLEKYIEKGDCIFLQGGGNFGNFYKVSEKIRRDIIKRFPNNKIILFPQTIYFSKDNEGKKELLKSIEIYSKHKKLMLIAREKNSYKEMCKNFKNNKVILTPDIVLYLDKTNLSCNRYGALLCCRNDIEGILSDSDRMKIKNQLKLIFAQVKVTDTIGENSFESVENKLNEFRKSKLVITDRLHGMIFAVITGTPCIALSNYNYKVEGTYEWIKNLGYIKFTRNLNEIPVLINELNKIEKIKYDNSFAIEEYKKIIKYINK